MPPNVALKQIPAGRQIRRARVILVGVTVHDLPDGTTAETRQAVIAQNSTLPDQSKLQESRERSVQFRRPVGYRDAFEGAAEGNATRRQKSSSRHAHFRDRYKNLRRDDRREATNMAHATALFDRFELLK